MDWALARDISTTLAAIAALIGFIILILRFLKDVYTPSFIVGILPRERREDLVIEPRSIEHEKTFNKGYLAGCANEIHSMLEDDRRYIEFKAGKPIDLHIVVQNVGARQADRYALAIDFVHENVSHLKDVSRKVGLVDVKTETLQLDALYVHDKRHLNDHLLCRNPPAEIREKYTELEFSDFVAFTGRLESGASEMIYLKLKILEEIDDDFHFFTRFRIDNPAWILPMTRVRLQPIRVTR